MPTQVELFEYQDVPVRESIQGLLDAGGRAGLKLGGLYVPKVLAQSGVSLVLPSSGSVGNNGALTLTTGLASAIPFCYMYMPANAIFAGSTAGFYYAVMNTTTSVTLYQERYTSGVPLYVETPTPWVTTGPGAYTQTTGADITFCSFVIPGGTPGPTGRLLIDLSLATVNNANTKTFKFNVGGSLVYSSTGFLTGQTGSRAMMAMYNRGRADRQVYTSVSAGFGAGTNGTFSSVDTSQDYTLTWSGQLAVATDYIQSDPFSIQVFQGD